MVWTEMMQAALRMGLGPDMFWRLSLREWRMLTAAVGVAGPLGRSAFERMAQRWPDGDRGGGPSTPSRHESEAR